MARRIEQEDLTASLAETLQFISHQHPPDFVRALRRAHAAETHAPAKAAMEQFDVPPENLDRSKLEVRSLPSAPVGARRSDEEVEVYGGADHVCAMPGGLGTPVADVCRQLRVSEATFYIWKKKYGDLGASEVRRLRQLEEENSRLKRVVADLTLDKNILQEVIRKKV